MSRLIWIYTVCTLVWILYLIKLECNIFWKFPDVNFVLFWHYKGWKMSNTDKQFVAVSVSISVKLPTEELLKEIKDAKEKQMKEWERNICTQRSTISVAVVASFDPHSSAMSWNKAYLYELSVDPGCYGTKTAEIQLTAGRPRRCSLSNTSRPDCIDVQMKVLSVHCLL